MAHVSELISSDIGAYLKAQERKGLLRFITCGSVDDGKSSLIGRLLFESKLLFEDQLATLASDSKRIGTTGGELDFALLLDGLSAEREQGITIDVAYRFFSTERRKFIVADTPGHEQYTRNMVTGASTADVAIILIDARKGVLTQTRRHSSLVSLLGIRHIALAINKMDLVEYSESRFLEIQHQFQPFAEQIGLKDVRYLPISAVQGDNITRLSERTPWFRGPSLMEYLETVEVDEDRLQRAAFRLPVQWVNRPNLDFRGFAGLVASGLIRQGARVRISPAGTLSSVARIVTADGDLDQAVAGQSVTLTLRDEIDVSRGDVISAADAPPEVADQFEATIVWMHEQPLLRGRSYLMKIGAKTVTATILPIKYKINVNTLEQLAATRLELNEIGVCVLELALDAAEHQAIEFLRGFDVEWRRRLALGIQARAHALHQFREFRGTRGDRCDRDFSVAQQEHPAGIARQRRGDERLAGMQHAEQVRGGDDLLHELAIVRRGGLQVGLGSGLVLL